MLSGLQGYFKGGVIGAAVGTVGGMAIGLAVGAMASALVPALVVGATLGALSFGVIGSLAGGMTGIIVKSREGQMSAEEAAKAVKIAYTRGVETGPDRAQEIEAEESKWRDRYAKEQNTRASDVQPSR